MPLSRSRDYLSIGEVLEAVRSDFPDISISKIRFLESEGLISPERTGSGYRKFYEEDLARLRYILSLQRDHFLPLRVIRDRLAQADADGGVASAPASSAPASEPAPARVPTDMTDVQLDRGELLEATGLTQPELASLEEFGIVTPDERAYDGDDVLLARAAKGFLERGLEPRHLRMYRQFAERQVALFEQIVGPVALRKDPDGRRDARASIAELGRLAARLHDACLRSTIRKLG